MKQILAVVLLVMALSTSPAAAQNIAAGKEIAQSSCTGCHSVDTNGMELRNEAVPSFTTIAQSHKTTEIWLESFLSTHPKMRNYVLSRLQIRDVAAYILSLKK
jgi:mono/diheme cytochrome c family protein